MGSRSQSIKDVHSANLGKSYLGQAYRPKLSKLRVSNYAYMSRIKTFKLQGIRKHGHKFGLNLSVQLSESNKETYCRVRGLWHKIRQYRCSVLFDDFCVCGSYWIAIHALPFISKWKLGLKNRIVIHRCMEAITNVLMAKNLTDLAEMAAASCRFH